MKRKRLNAMPALLKFLVLLAIFLSASYAHAFTSLSPVAGNQARANHLIRFEEGEIGKIYSPENFDTPLYTPSFFACRISHMTFFSVDMCKLLSEIIQLARTNNLASQLSHVFFCRCNLLVLKFCTRYLLVVQFSHNIYTLSKKPFL